MVSGSDIEEDKFFKIDGTAINNEDSDDLSKSQRIHFIQQKFNKFVFICI